MAFLTSSFHVSPILLLLLGFCVGTISGFYGIGGGWLITPVLNILGLPMSYAIGTSLVYVVITATFGTISHRKLKNVSFISGIIIGIAAIGGIVVGRKCLIFLETRGTTDSVIRVLYIIFLTSVGIYMILSNSVQKADSPDINQKRLLPPYLTVYRDTRTTIKVSFFLLVIIGVSIGVLNVTMGVGGGFILFPLFVYLFNFPVPIAVGTSLFSILVVVLQASSLYIISHHIDWVSVIFMAVMSIPGSFVGSQDDLPGVLLKGVKGVKKLFLRPFFG